MRLRALPVVVGVALLVVGCSAPPSHRTMPEHRRSPSAGSSPSTTTSTTSSTTSTTASASPSPSRTPDGQRFTTVNFGAEDVRETTLHGATSGVSMKVWVWTPPQYDDPRYAHTEFPVLFLYPGGDGATYNNWTDRSYSAQEVVDQGSRDGSVLPFVFVMPEMQVSKDVDTECTDLPGQPAVGTFLDTDVPAMVQHDFRVLPPGKGWGTAGASSGAYCAAAIALRHPGEYGAVVSIAGYFDMETNLPHKAPAVQALYPSALAPGFGGTLAWLLVAGTDSPEDVTQAQRFSALVTAPSSAQVALQDGGKHLTTSFKAAMPQVFAFFSQHLQAPVSSR
ncbi:alpha/beta hydrolase [Kineococcus rhizosphaerae]|uniref:alpha/beta hydrolase n=1 Tax=Kineococcus rhizosphaerae TaxID=559628 RepID=UPI0011B275F2|nr:alpha/beta hydrolase-fold protein [Kineococcus rhizosphaerae]